MINEERDNELLKDALLVLSGLQPKQQFFEKWKRQYNFSTLELLVYNSNQVIVSTNPPSSKKEETNS